MYAFRCIQCAYIHSRISIFICQGKSALWSHLLHYQESKEKTDAAPAGLGPPGKLLVESWNVINGRWCKAIATSLSLLPTSGLIHDIERRKSDAGAALAPLKVSLIRDMRWVSSSIHQVYHSISYSVFRCSAYRIYTICQVSSWIYISSHMVLKWWMVVRGMLQVILYYSACVDYPFCSGRSGSNVCLRTSTYFFENDNFESRWDNDWLIIPQNVMISKCFHCHLVAHWRKTLSVKTEYYQWFKTICSGKILTSAS